MRTRRKTKPFLAASAAKKPRVRPAAIDASRANYMAIIDKFRLLTGETNSFVEKAHRLLTSHWSGATWAARMEILKTVDWLIRIATSMREPRPAALAPRGQKAALAK